MNNTKSDWTKNIYNIVDLLQSESSKHSFPERVKNLNLSSSLEERISKQQTVATKNYSKQTQSYLLEIEERELASEVLLCRHQFTEIVAQYASFRQASLTIIQNIYLFKQRKIFFSSGLDTTEQERQKAVLLLGLSLIHI